MQQTFPTPKHHLAAGILYLAIILLGLTSELAVRAPLVGLTPSEIATRITETETAVRLSIAADAVMVVADIALAPLLFVLFAPVDRGIAAVAALFRLVQAATIAGNLTHQQAALEWAIQGEAGLAATSMHLHAAGYDNGLIFFGVNALLTGWLLLRHAGFPSWLGALMSLAGATYLTGSFLRILAPDLATLFQPVYLVAIIAETAFMALLLRRGLAGGLAPATQG